jgi:hypothetical protein
MTKKTQHVIVVVLAGITLPISILAKLPLFTGWAIVAGAYSSHALFKGLTK